MLKKTFAFFTLTICGMMNLQAMEVVAASHSTTIQHEVNQDQSLACCGKKKRRHAVSFSNDESLLACCGKRKPKKKKHAVETFLGCGKCKGKHVVA